AEELQKLTVIHICGTYRLFEDGSYKYVIRASSQAVTDSVGAAAYVVRTRPDVKTVAGINDDYAWGRDSWEMFIHALRKLKPDVQVREELWPKAFIGEYSAEISKLQSARPDVIHPSLWGGHMDNFLQPSHTPAL